MKFWIIIFLNIYIYDFATANVEDVKLIEGLKLEVLSGGSKIELPSIGSTDQTLIVDSESALIVVNENLRFYSLTKKKFIDRKAISLPKDCLSLALVGESATIQKSLYCFGHKKNSGGDSIRIFKKGIFEPLIKTPNKISAVTGDFNRIFFISQDALFQIRIHEGVKPVFISTFLNGIQSIVLDSKNDLIFLASKDQIYSLRGGVLDILVKGLGGHIALVGNDLLITDQQNKIWRLVAPISLLIKNKDI